MCICFVHDYFYFSAQISSAKKPIQYFSILYQSLTKIGESQLTDILG